MKHVIHVSKFSNQAPIWWMNFLRSLPLIKSNSAFHSMINTNLKKWNAVYLEHSVERPTIIFDTEKDAAIFIFKWS